MRTELGLEWYVVTDGSNVVLLSGDVGKSESWALQFEGVVESMYRTDDDDMKDSPLIGHGLGLHGLFRVHNSEWKREGHFHFIVCGKGGELSCLAQRYSSRTIAEPIESIRQRVLIIRTLK